MKRALIFGINGQDGSYLAEILIEKGYEVNGTIRRSSVITTERIEHIFKKIKLHYCDMTDTMNIYNIIDRVKPDEIYNFSAQSHVKISAELEDYTFRVNTLGVLNILQSVRNIGIKCKIYQASTSEIMGNTTDGTFKMNENSKQTPVSIYGISKHAAQEICNMYRDAYGMFVVNSILYNHESRRRGHNFVTQKIAMYVARYKLGLEETELELGNLNARRDWGDAREYMEAVYLMLQKEEPDNYVIATGETHSVREYVEEAFKEIGIEIEWSGEGTSEIGRERRSGRVIVRVNEKYYRDIEIDCLIGDSRKAREKLGWENKKKFREIVKDMVRGAIERYE